MNHCNSCSTNLPDDAMFCSKCGTKVERQVVHNEPSYPKIVDIKAVTGYQPPMVDYCLLCEEVPV